MYIFVCSPFKINNFVPLPTLKKKPVFVRKAYKFNNCISQGSILLCVDLINRTPF